MVRYGKVKYYIIWVIVILAMFVFISKVSAGNEKNKKNNNSKYFHFQDKVFEKKFSFTPKMDEIIVSFSPDSTTVKMKKIAKDEKLTAVHFFEKKRFGVYKLPPSTVSHDNAISQIRGISGVKSAAPVMVDQEEIERYFIPHQFSVQFKKGTLESRIQEIITSNGCSIVKRQRTPGYYTLAIPEGKLNLEKSHGNHGKALFETIREFIALDEVKFAEPSYVVINFLQEPFYPNDVEFPAQWNLDDTGQRDPNTDCDISAPEAWEIERGAQNVVVAVIDTGIDINHEDLVENLLPREGEDWDFSDGQSKIPQDLVGHGTCVAGIAAAVTNNQYGVAGIAHGCRIMPIKIEFGAGSGQDQVDAINYIAEHSEKHPQYRYVVNCSWGGGGDSTAVHEAIINVKNHNIVMCFASGNDNLNQVSYPARYPEVIAVGAMSPCEERKSPTSCDGENLWGSNYGPELDVVAPGVFLTTTDITGIGGYNEEGDYNDSFGGTSGACPHVAGLAALLISQYPNMDVPGVEATIQLNARDIEAAGWDEETGFGLIASFDSLSNPLNLIKFDLNPDISTNHPYNNDANIVWEIHHPDATAMRIHFSAFDTESGCDFVYVTDANGDSYGPAYDGNLGSFTSYIIPGDTVRIRLVSDYSVTEYGFDIDYYECFVKNVYVDCNAIGSNNGTSWDDAYTTIQAGINDPNTIDGSTIWVAGGVYRENVDFKGKSIALRSITDPNNTIIDANDSGGGVYFSTGTDGAVLSGFTITGGSVRNGGGIYCYYASPTINNCIITANIATYGGGIRCDHSSPTITQCTIIANTSTSQGGGIQCYYATPNFNNCSITGNSSDRGGGLYCYKSDLNITNCIINENTSTNGGGMYFWSSSPTIVNCTISENSSNSCGGGIYFCISSPTFINTIITGNSAYYHGGGICDTASSATISNCTIYGNSANGNGGALYCSSSSPTITNCILWADSPQEIYVTSGTPIGTPTVTFSDVQYSSGTYPGNGNINEDPLFLDPVGGDFHLQEGSPCLNEGSDVGAPDDDKDGNPRPCDSGYDMGAYELMIIHVQPGGSIQQAIDNAVDGSVIIVHQGIYSENINFGNRAITLRSTDPDDPTVVQATIIDGNQINSVVTFNGDNGLNDPREGHKSMLSGLTLQNGSGFVLGADTLGGAIYCEGASPSITNCRIIASTADFGGGIFCNESSPIISNCEITGNAANDSGGGIYCYYGSAANIMNCAIYNNDALLDSGGGILINQSAVNIANCTFNQNTAVNGEGGGIYSVAFNEMQRPTVVNSIFWHDNAIPDLTGQDEIFDHDPDFPAKVTFSDVEVLAGVYPGQGNINADPQFVNELNGDYHLQNISPCMNVGIDAETIYDYKVPYADKDNNPRPIGAAYDMGAYEFVVNVWHVPGDFSTIQQAINAANDWDAIVVHPGMYVENINFGGEAITVISENPWDPEVVASTLIDGNQIDSVVKFSQGEDLNCVLSGFTIQNGYFSQGGGINCTSSPTISNCIISGNSSTSYGGGILSNAGGRFINCTITENTSDYSSGGAYTGGTSTLINCIISRNSATLSTYSCGGGIYCSQTPTIRNCVITENSVYRIGGGIYCTGTPTITNCTIAGNSVVSYGGGGIFCSMNSSPNITGCNIVGNNSTSSGGGIYCYSWSTPNIDNCIIRGNTATSYGGGIYGINPCSAVITNCVISENYAYDAGAIYCYKGGTITNCTITKNGPSSNPPYSYFSAIYCGDATITDCIINENYGNGINCFGTTTISNCTINGNSNIGVSGGNLINCVITDNSHGCNGSDPITNCTIVGNSNSGVLCWGSEIITNCIIWDNSAQQIEGYATVTYSDIQGGYSGTGNIDIDPQFINPDAEDYHLEAISPCIDTGTNNGAPATDKDGVTRPQDGDGDWIAICDMGAYELIP